MFDKMKNMKSSFSAEPPIGTSICFLPRYHLIKYPEGVYKSLELVVTKTSKVT